MGVGAGGKGREGGNIALCKMIQRRSVGISLEQTKTTKFPPLLSYQNHHKCPQTNSKTSKQLTIHEIGPQSPVIFNPLCGGKGV